LRRDDVCDPETLGIRPVNRASGGRGVESRSNATDRRRVECCAGRKSYLDLSPSRDDVLILKIDLISSLGVC